MRFGVFLLLLLLLLISRVPVDVGVGVSLGKFRMYGAQLLFVEGLSCPFLGVVEKEREKKELREEAFARSRVERKSLGREEPPTTTTTS